MAIVGMVGKARSGKDTFATFLKEAFKDLTGEDYIFMAYAEVLKSQCAENFGLSQEQLYGDDKEVNDARYPGWTAREIMQAYGDFCRNLNPDYWVNKVVDKIDKNCYNNVIITDIRYPNELKAINIFDGKTIKIERNNAPGVHGATHSSETALDDVDDYDFVVDNSGTLEEFKEIAYTLVHRLITVARANGNKNEREEVSNG